MRKRYFIFLLMLLPGVLALNFRVKDDSSTFFMVNGSSGYVGVGLINPIALFHVNGNAYVDGDLNVTGTIFGGSPVKVGGGLNITSGDLYFSDGSSMSSASAGGGSSIWTNSSGNATFTSGNVGIGTTTPEYRLELVGDFKISDPSGNAEIKTADTAYLSKEWSTSSEFNETGTTFTSGILASETHNDLRLKTT